MLTLLLIGMLTLVLGELIAVASASDPGKLAFDKTNVSWIVGSEPTGRKFDLKVNITDVVDLKGMVFSVEWDSFYLDALSYTPGDFLPLGCMHAFTSSKE